MHMVTGGFEQEKKRGKKEGYINDVFSNNHKDTNARAYPVRAAGVWLVFCFFASQKGAGSNPVLSCAVLLTA